MIAASNWRSVIRSLASGIWIRYDADESRVLVIEDINHYSDASNKEETPNVPLVVGGVVTTVSKWVDFDARWSEVLEREGVPYLRMSQCAAWQGPFKHWDKDEARRIQFLKDLMCIMADTIEHTQIVSIWPKDFNKTNEVFHLAREGFRSPYPLVARMCMYHVDRWAEEKHAGKRMVHFVEQGDTGETDLNQLLAKHPELRQMIISVPKTDPQTGEHLTPLQAADLVAYEHYLEIKRRKESSEILPRRLFLAIHERMPSVNVREMTEESITHYCGADPEAFPRRPSAP